MKLVERKHAWAQCEQCPLAEDGRFVPSEIPTNPRLVVVGEAPGFEEVKYGRPFIGPSGQLLDQVLKHHGYEREEVMYTNAALCRPSNNTTPPKAAIRACRERLLREIIGSGVQDILALGGTASATVIDDRRLITTLRMGPPKSPTDDFLRLSKHIEGGNGGPTRVVASWHPAYALRNSDAFPSLVADVGKLKGVKTDIWQPPDWKYFENPVDAQTVLTQIMAWQDLHQSYELVVDIETGIDKDNSYDHPNEYDLLCVGLGYTKGKVVVIGYDPCHAKSVLDLLKKLFRRSKLIAQNGKFDLAGLYPHLGPLELWFDTMLASYCLDERPGNHKLKTLGLELLGTPEWEHEILRFIPRGGNYANIPRPVLYKYNAYDVAVTWDLKELFTPKLDTPRRPDDWPYQDRPFKSLRDLHDFLVRASNQLMFLELNGLTIDRAYQNKLREIFGVRLGTLESRLTEIAGYELNPRSPKQLKEYFAEQKIMLDSTNKDTLEQLLEILRKRDDTTSDTVQFIETLLVHRRQQKLSSTYVEGIRKRMYRGRVYSTYLLHGSTSGRLTSRNPNLQNIDRDRDIRRQFAVAKPENIFVHTDFKQAEGRVIAYLAQDEYLREVFNNPKIDIFDELSNQLYGVGNWRKEVERIRTKAFFYGLSYGREAYSIAMEFGLSVSEAERRMQEFLSLIPATAAWQKATRDEVLAGKDLITPFGRRRRFWLITEHNKKDILNEALSFLPQSTSSDICLDALIHIRPRLRGIGFVRLTIHDALVAECHESRREEVTNIMIEEMMAAGERFTNYVPFPVDVSYGKTWGDL